jgi:hypothetical protein
MFSRVIPSLLGTLALLGGCSVQEPVQGNGEFSKKQIEIPPSVTRVEVGGGLQVEIKASANRSGQLEGDSNVLPLISVESSGDTLRIGPLLGSSYSTVRPVVARLRLPVEHLVLRGSSSASLMLNGGSFKLETTGNSEVTGSGRLDMLHLIGSGSSRANLRGCSAKDARVALSGSSDATVFVTGSLDIRLSGAASLRALGGAQVRNQEVSGAAKLLFK